MSPRTFAWLCLAALLAAPLALADEKNESDDEERDGHDEAGERDRRKLELDVDDLKATFKLSREVDGVEDAVKISFDAQHAKVQVKHEEKDAQNESEQKLEARFLALVEYLDADNDSAYDPGEQLASAWALGESEKDAKIDTNGTVEWANIAVSDVASGNASGKKLSSRASFGENATFGLDFYVYGDFTTVGNASLAPTEAKIDIVIEHYPYVQDDTALAVIVDLKAKEEFETEGEGEGEGGVFSEVESGNLTFRLTFTWLETATVDGVEQSVHATVIKDKSEVEGDEISQKSRVALSYARGDLIVHDPTVGVDYVTQSDSAGRAVPMPGVALVLAVAGLAALAGARRRR